MANSRATETRHAEGATAPETSAARAKAAAVTAKAPTMPASAACVGLEREKRDYEEQRRDSANAGHRPPAPGA